MLLSIITINYNNCSGLKKTIESVICQTFTDYEWIVIDGGSTDGSKELIEQYSDHFSYWCSEPDKGIYNAMNKGIDHARGDYYQFLNSGDYLFSDITLQSVFSKEYNEDLLYGDYKLENQSYIKRFPSELSLSFFLDDCLNHQASFYRNSLFENNRYDESFKIVSDWAFYFQLVLQGKSFKHIPIVIVEFEPNGIGSILTEYHKKEKELALQKYLPPALLRETETLTKYKIFKKRKSFLTIIKWAYQLCLQLDKILVKVDQIHNNKI